MICGSGIYNAIENLLKPSNIMEEKLAFEYEYNEYHESGNLTIRIGSNTLSHKIDRIILPVYFGVFFFFILNVYLFI
jgi:hypothetical protein